MKPDYYIGIDAGTSFLKAIAFDRQGRQVAGTRRKQHYNVDKSGSATQDMNAIWHSLVDALSELVHVLPELSKDIVAIGLTGQGDGTWMIDQSGAPVQDAMLWLDKRSGNLAKDFSGLGSVPRGGGGLGLEMNASKQLSQLAWLVRTSPEVLERASVAFHCKDWLYFKLTGAIASDPSEGLPPGDEKNARLVLSQIGLAGYERLFPRIVDGSKESCGLSAEAARKTGLKAGTPVSLAYVDGVCSAIGAGTFVDDLSSGGVSILGTAGVHIGRLWTGKGSRPLDSSGTPHISFPDGHSAQLQATMSASQNIDWILSLLSDFMRSGEDAAIGQELLTDLEGQILSLGPTSAIFLPYIATGERAPFLNPNAKASITNLDSSFGLIDLIRCIFEGIAFAARDCFENMDEFPETVALVGGIGRSSAFATILASILQRDIIIREIEEAGALGAAMFAAVGSGSFSGFSEASKIWVGQAKKQIVQPNQSEKLAYKTAFERYRATRSALEPVWGL